MDPLPLFVSGMAAVRSKRGDYVSPLDDPGAIPVPVKRCFADADLVRQAVTLLKQRGFRVGSVDRFGAWVEGPPDLFMKTFSVTLERHGDGAALGFVGSDRAGFIDTSRHPDFAPLLAGIVFCTPGARYGDEEPPPKPDDKPWVLYLEELPGYLGAGKQSRSTKPVKVTAVDTGFSFKHPWFAKLRQTRANDFYVQTLRADTEVEAAWAAFTALLAAKPQMSNQDKLFELDSFQERQQSVAARDRDPDGHGTAVMANILAMAPQCDVSLLRIFPLRSTIEYIAEAIRTTGRSQTVVSLSVGPSATFDSQARSLPYTPETALMQAQMALAQSRGVLVVAATGNDPAVTPVWVGSDVPLIVGSCLRDSDGTFKAAPTVGYVAGETMGRRSIPHVCGLGGGFSVAAWGYLYCPRGMPSQTPGAWSLQGGSSFATPQVAAVCAMVWAAFPGAKPEQVKQIVMATANPVYEGKTANGDALTDILHEVDGIQFPAGLIHIGKAFVLAQLCNVLFNKGVQGASVGAVLRNRKASAYLDKLR